MGPDRPPRRPEGRSLAARPIARWASALFAVLGTVAGAVAAALLALVLLYAWVPVPGTPLMVVRLFEGEGLKRDWVALSTLPPHVPRAVLAAEDQRFCEHWGLDLVQLQAAIEEGREGGRLRGASTLSMQTAKNVFLWPGRSWLRKVVEVPATFSIELLWGKRRILEVYLNVAEWGPGVYGIEAAAHHHFGVAATELTELQAATLAAILPSPRDRSAAQPGPYTRERARAIRRDLGWIDASCVGAGPGAGK